jgi:uncharacterized protein with von Willebrand factor type A (vWA) domain
VAASKALINRRGSIEETRKQRGLSFAEAFISVEAILIIDHSGSMSTSDVVTEDGRCSRWDEANRQLQRLQSRFPGRLAVVAFSDSAEFRPDGTLPPIQSSTNLRDALSFISPADGTGIKLIVCSDGRPDDEEGALRVASGLESAVNTIFLGADPRGRDFMQRLANLTKGKAVVKAVDLLEKSIVLLLTDGR